MYRSPGRWSAGPAVAIALLLGAGAASAQQTAKAQAPSPAAGLTIAGDVSKPTTLTLADLKAMPRTTVTVDDQGKPVKYEGVLVSEVLSLAGAPIGRGMGSDSLAAYVRASASDGYEVVFSIGELDQGLSATDILIADTADGKPLFDYQGPLRLVVPHDKRGARSVRMLVRLDVVRLRK